MCYLLIQTSRESEILIFSENCTVVSLHNIFTLNLKKSKKKSIYKVKTKSGSLPTGCHSSLLLFCLVKALHIINIRYIVFNWLPPFWTPPPFPYPHVLPARGNQGNQKP